MDGQLTSTRFVVDSFMQLLGLDDDAETVPAKDDFLPDHLKTKTKAKGQPMHERLLDDFSIRSDLDEDSDDVEIAAWFLFQDMQHMRDYVKETWLDYTEGRTTLVTASFLSTEAVVIVKEMEKEFFDTFSSHFKHRTYADLMAAMFPDVESSFERFYPFLKTLPHTTQNFLMCMTWARIFFYGKTIVKEVYRAPLPGSIVEFDPSADTSGWTEERFRVERDGLLVKHLAEVHFQALRSSVKQQCIDENALVGDFRAFLDDKDHTVPLHLVFQWQIWQDHVVINRQCLQQSLDQLQEVPRNVTNAARHWLQKGYSPELYTDNHVEGSKRDVETHLIEQLPKIVFDDELGETKRRDRLRTIIVPFQIFLYNPWGCGIAILKILCLTQHICTDIINGTGLFTSTLQLYDALLQHGKIERWPLMDHLLDISAPTMYHAGRPKPGTFLIANNIANGGDPSRMSGQKYPNYRCDGHGTGALRPGGTWLERIMETQKFVLTDKDIEELFPRPGDEKQVTVPKPVVGSRTVRFGSKHCDPYTLLCALKDHVAAEFENSGLGVDLFMIEMFSICVLQQWNRCAWSYFVQFFGEGYMERPSQVVFLVGYLFMGLESREKVAERGHVISEDSVNKMFNEAAAAFQKAKEDVERGIVKGGSISYFGERDHGAFWNEFRTATLHKF